MCVYDTSIVNVHMYNYACTNELSRHNYVISLAFDGAEWCVRLVTSCPSV